MGLSLLLSPSFTLGIYRAWWTENSECQTFSEQVVNSTLPMLDDLGKPDKLIHARAARYITSKILASIIGCNEVKIGELLSFYSA